MHHVNSVEFGGKSTLSHLELTPSADDHGEIYSCKASNDLIGRAVSDAVTLDVRCTSGRRLVSFCNFDFVHFFVLF